MNTIFIGFSGSSLVGSLFIKEIEKRPYSHVYVRFQHPITNEWIITHAARGMVHEVTFDHFKQTNDIIKEYPIVLTADQWYSFHKVNNYYKGSDYSLGQFLLITLKKLLKVNNKKTNMNKKFICSEWAYVLLTKIGFMKDTAGSQDSLTPSDFENLLNG